MIYPKHIRKIVLCSNCCGEGMLMERTYDYNLHGAATVFKPCPDCGGTGRLEININITYKKLTPNEPEENR